MKKKRNPRVLARNLACGLVPVLFLACGSSERGDSATNGDTSTGSSTTSGSSPSSGSGISSSGGGTPSTGANATAGGPSVTTGGPSSTSGSNAGTAGATTGTAGATGTGATGSGATGTSATGTGATGTSATSDTSSTTGGTTGGTSGTTGTTGGSGSTTGRGTTAGTTGAVDDGGIGGGTGSTTGGGSSACSGTSTLAKGDSNHTTQVGDTSRKYILHVPASYTGTTAVPLVIDFHPLGGTGASEKGSSGFQTLSDRDGFVIAWPDGIDNAWNIGPCCTRSRTVDDLGFAKAIVSEIEANGCIDAKRVYATGFSMGGGMSHYLACNAADVFAAAAPSAFDLLEEDEEPCHPSRPISVLSFRGTSDNVVPYAGGASQPPNGCCSTVHFLGAVGTLNRWAELDGCTGTAMTSGSTQMFMQCNGGVQVGLYTIQGGGHAPGPADTAWSFLKTQSLP